MIKKPPNEQSRIRRGQAIRKAREARGWSQTGLGARIGVSRAAVSQWETGVNKTITGGHLVRISEELGLPIDEITLSPTESDAVVFEAVHAVNERADRYRTQPGQPDTPEQILARKLTQLPAPIKAHLMALLDYLLTHHDNATNKPRRHSAR